MQEVSNCYVCCGVYKYVKVLMLYALTKTIASTSIFCIDLVLHCFSIMDSLQECCHCNDSSVCFISIQCVDNLLSSLEKLSRGENLTASVIDAILQFSPQTDIGKLFCCTLQTYRILHRHSIK